VSYKRDLLLFLFIIIIIIIIISHHVISIVHESNSNSWFLVGIKLLLQGSVRAFWDEQRAYTKGTAGKLSHRNAEVCLDEMVNIASKSTYTNATCLQVDFNNTS